MYSQFKHTFGRLLAAVALFAVCSVASAGILRVDIDTSGFGGTGGYLDLQFGASSGGPLATATIGNLAGFGGASIVETWGVTTLPGGWRFRNDTANDLFLSVAFGGVLSFDLGFDGDNEPVAGIVSPFTIAAFDASLAPVGSFDPFTGALATFYWTPTASGPGAVMFSTTDAHVTVTAVPEPGTWLLVVIGLAALMVVRRQVDKPRHGG